MRNGIQHTIVATLDLASSSQRFVYDAITRMHTGRWPRFRALAMRQCDGFIHEAAEEVSRRKKRGPRRFLLLRWDLQGRGLFWTRAPSKRAVMTLLANAA